MNTNSKERLITTQSDGAFFDTSGINSGRESDPRIPALWAAGLGVGGAVGWGIVGYAIYNGPRIVQAAQDFHRVFIK